MPFLRSLDISGSGLTAQRFRMDVIAQNIANADTTRTQGGGAYRRKTVVFQTKQSFASILSGYSKASAGGVQVTAVQDDPSALKMVYDPTNPDANANGYVEMPNVDTTQEMIDMIGANRSYEANITAFNAVKNMASKALDIGR